MSEPLIVKLVNPHTVECSVKPREKWTYDGSFLRSAAGRIVKQPTWWWAKYTCWKGCPASVLVREDSITAAVEAALAAKGKK